MSWTAEEMDTALAGPVASVLFDHEGTTDIAALLESVPGTDFTGDEIAKILDNEMPPKDWEVGEAIAEAYLDPSQGFILPLARWQRCSQTQIQTAWRRPDRFS